MRIEARQIGSYRIVCTCRPGQPFTVAGMMLTVECPHCGKTAEGAELVTDWVTASRTDSLRDAAD